MTLEVYKTAGKYSRGSMIRNEFLIKINVICHPRQYGSQYDSQYGRHIGRRGGM